MIASEARVQAGLVLASELAHDLTLGLASAVAPAPVVAAVAATDVTPKLQAHFFAGLAASAPGAHPPRCQNLMG